MAETLSEYPTQWLEKQRTGCQPIFAELNLELDARLPTLNSLNFRVQLAQNLPEPLRHISADEDESTVGA
jgi:hypothetical protein